MPKGIAWLAVFALIVLWLVDKQLMPAPAGVPSDSDMPDHWRTPLYLRVNAPQDVNQGYIMPAQLYDSWSLGVATPSPYLLPGVNNG